MRGINSKGKRDNQSGQYDGEDAGEEDDVDLLNRTALHRFTINLRLQSLRDALKTPKSMNPPDKFGNTPIGLACIQKPENKEAKHDQKEILKLLLEKGADPNIENKRTRWTTLTWAARHGMSDMLSLLLRDQNDAFLHIPDKNGYYPIDYAGMCQHWKCVAILARQLIKNVERFIFMNHTKAGLAENELHDREE